MNNNGREFFKDKSSWTRRKEIQGPRHCYSLAGTSHTVLFNLKETSKCSLAVLEGAKSWKHLETGLHDAHRTHGRCGRPCLVPDASRHRAQAGSEAVAITFLNLFVF